MDEAKQMVRIQSMQSNQMCLKIRSKTRIDNEVINKKTEIDNNVDATIEEKAAKSKVDEAAVEEK